MKLEGLCIPAVLSLAFVAACDAPIPEQTPTKDSAAGSSTAKSSSQKPGATVKLPTAAAQTAKPDEPAKQAKGPFPESKDPNVTDPSKLTAKAPDKFKVAFETTAGNFDMECTRDWAPNGVDRFYNLVKAGFYDDVAFFRVVKTPKPFVVQFGIHGNPAVSKAWRDAQIPPDDPKQSNTRGKVTFAMAGSPDTRTTQLFINYGDNANLDKMGFAPICEVSAEAMNEVEKIFSGYGEKPSGAQGQIKSAGNAFLREKFPELDYIKTARLAGDDKDKKDDKKDDKAKDKKEPKPKADPAPKKAAATAAPKP